MIRRAEEKAMREISRRRLIAERERDLRVAATRERYPDLAALEDEIKGLVLAELGRAAKNVDYSFNGLTEKVKARDRLLSRYGIPPDYTTPRYTCQRCQDEGETNGIICECRRELEASLMPALFDVTLDVNQTFDTFNLNVFRNERRGKEEVSPRELMQNRLDVARFYTEHFAEVTDRDLYFYGRQGTGKTFLLSAIGNDLVRRGVDVIYLPAIRLFDTLFFYRRLRETYRPDSERLAEEEERRQAIYTTTLLLIDDLGTEAPREQSVLDVIDLLNVRKQNKLHTIIASNQSLSDLKKNYDVRIASRLGAFTAYQLFGDDIRLILSGNVERKQ